MPTLNQLVKNKRKKKLHKTRAVALEKRPQRRAFCIKVTTVKPKKPNSAIRKIAKVKIIGGKTITVYIPGQGHSIQQYSNLLIRGGRVKDLPGVNYKALKGVLDFSWKENFLRMQKRSKYGSPKRYS